ncbi:MAG: class I SAM-dependent methyltransferase [Chloroflexota bacterium]
MANNETFLANRLRKRQRHLRKWARRRGVTCYRLYERDIPEYPLIVDWYDGEAVVWLYERTRDESIREAKAWKQQALTEIRDALELTREQVFVKERKRQQGSAQYEKLESDNQAEGESHVRLVQEQGLTFEINLSDYLDTGLFLDHRNTRAEVREIAAGKSVLNLFAYTGSFTCYAAAGGARTTTTVDLSQTYCEWARRNLAHNGVEASFDRGSDYTVTHRLVQADCHAFLMEAIRNREQYDIIICDPPTFSNTKRKGISVFDVNKDYPGLLKACSVLLSKTGVLYFSTNARKFKLDKAQLPQQLMVDELTPKTIPEDFRNKQIHQCWRFRQRS